MRTLDSVDILERLVSCRTVSRDSNLPLIDWVRNYLADYGVRSHLVPDATGGKSNLFATVGPAEEGGLVLSGHTDVVPVDGQAWSSDPFSLTERDSRLYGRGTCDMKGFIAAVLSRVHVWRTMKLVRPVHFMFSYDEEVGCLGAPSMIAAAQRVLPEPAAVIVGEPTSMKVANEHKGICAVRTRVRGIEAHSSLTHRGVSAVMLAGEMVAELIQISRELSARATARRGFEPPYTTLSVNRIQGGTAINILAAACEFDWDVRSLPREVGTSIIERAVQFAVRRVAELSAEGKQCAIETTVEADVPPLRADNGVAEELARAAAGFSTDALTLPFATEAGQFQSAGWSTVVCGPGSIEQAHRADEFIERSEVLACETFLERAVARHCRRQG